MKAFRCRYCGQLSKPLYGFAPLSCWNCHNRNTILNSAFVLVDVVDREEPRQGVSSSRKDDYDVDLLYDNYVSARRKDDDDY